MKTSAAFLLSLAVLGAFAKPQSNNFRSNAFNGAYGSSLPVLNTHIQAPVVENPTVVFPSYDPLSSISESCHCLNTLVRPQIRNEIITVPTVDRIVRTIPSAIVETVNRDGGTRVATFSNLSNFLSTITEGRSLSQGVSTTTSTNTNKGHNKYNLPTNQNNGESPTIERLTFFAIQTPGRNTLSNDRSNIFMTLS